MMQLQQQNNPCAYFMEYIILFTWWIVSKNGDGYSSSSIMHAIYDVLIDFDQLYILSKTQ